MSVRDALAASAVVPVVVIDDAARAIDLAHALLAGGIGCAEFTLRTPAAVAALAAAATVPGFTVGAGTVLTTRQADEIVDAGAVFAVSPGYDPALAEAIRARGVAMIPGVATASEQQHALSEGFTDVKVFPAGLLGGPDYLRALSAPFSDARFVPRGGIDQARLAVYLAVPEVLTVCGSWIASRAAIEAGAFDAVSAAARASSTVRDGLRGAR